MDLSYLQEIPKRWWAVVVGVVFGSIALITINGPKEGYGKAAITAAGLSPVLSIIAGALLPRDTPLEIAALVGGVAALGGTALVFGIARKAPAVFTAAFEGMAKAYLGYEISKYEKPLKPNPEIDAAMKKMEAVDDDSK